MRDLQQSSICIPKDLHCFYKLCGVHVCFCVCICVCMCVSVCNVCLMNYPSEMGLREEDGTPFFLQVCVFIDYVLGAKFSGYCFT